MFPDNALSFTCNICGCKNLVKVEKLSREISSCMDCESTIRFRSIIHVLSLELFGKSIVLRDFPTNKDINGLGMSDAYMYAELLSEKFSYQNKYFHEEPRFDITDISSEQTNSLDFIISSEVYEHVLFPVSTAFINTRKLLKDNGVFVFTVPYLKEGDSTIEHFGQLHDFEILKIDDNYTLRDTNRDGNVREFSNLVFHGGDGSTLEMRIFCEKSLIDELTSAGFTKIKFHGESYLKYGIYHPTNWSLPITARIN